MKDFIEQEIVIGDYFVQLKVEDRYHHDPAYLLFYKLVRVFSKRKGGPTYELLCTKFVLGKGYRKADITNHFPYNFLKIVPSPELKQILL